MAVRDLIPRMRSRTSVSRGEGINPLVAFHEEMNRLFDDFWRDFDGIGTSLMPSSGFPRVEVIETERDVKVEAELPGMEEKDVEVLLHNGVLTIRGERQSESEDKHRRVSERYYGQFERRVVLPAEVDGEKVTATFHKGVLTVTLPKTARELEDIKRIRVSSK
ncbi:heat shock protein Hsp20 [mine drainage metagenome]|jgi:HSP20 family protein|uniref:Heat shock protein Hsp20 n=1 Tax=mine drainage metagenome TaxID=410659 RepID=T1BA46_9ZZZZ